jgi:putative membrane protein
VRVTPGRPVALAHDDGAVQPHDLWTAWNADPLVIGGLLLVGWLYLRGRSRRPGSAGGWRAPCFAAGLLAIAAALLTPLDALSGALASAHMAQHLLLTLVAAPLLVLSAPGARLLRGSPAAIRQGIASWRRRLRVHVWAPVVLSAGTAWLLHVGAFWAWHAAVLYEAALRDPAVHALEHTTFLGTGLLFWRTVLGVRAARVPAGLAVLLVFGMAMSSALLSLLLTFADRAWYPSYATTASAWGIDALTDQQLAGVTMWIPAGVVHVAVALGVLVTWLRALEHSSDRDAATGTVPGPSGGPAPQPAAVSADPQR